MKMMLIQNLLEPYFEDLIENEKPEIVVNALSADKDFKKRYQDICQVYFDQDTFMCMDIEFKVVQGRLYYMDKVLYVDESMYTMIHIVNQNEIQVQNYYLDYKTLVQGQSTSNVLSSNVIRIDFAELFEELLENGEVEINEALKKVTERIGNKNRH